MRQHRSVRDARVEWARNGEVLLAYQVVSDGNADVLVCGGTAQHIESWWDHPEPRHLLERLAALGRLILTDKRGVGLSDRPTSLPTLEERVDDLVAVLDAVASTRAAVLTLGEPDTVGMAAMLAATRPDKVSHLVLYQPVLRVVGDGNGMVPPAAWPQFTRRTEQAWGSGEVIGSNVEHLRDRVDVGRWLERAERRAGTPRWRATLSGLFAELDLAAVFPAVKVPTLVLRRPARSEAVLNRQAPAVASLIPGAQLVDLPGIDNLNVFDGGDSYADAVAAFLRGVEPETFDDRVLATVLFTDIVGSTEQVVALGDAAWRNVLAFHDAVTAEEVTAHRGQVIKSTGDGALAIFDGPARAVGCALRIRALLSERGITMRMGLHTGEVEKRERDVAGVAVHIASRVLAAAGDGTITASRTVRDLTAGSDVTWQALGSHTLKGVPGEWELFSVQEPAAPTL